MDLRCKWRRELASPPGASRPRAGERDKTAVILRKALLQVIFVEVICNLFRISYTPSKLKGAVGASRRQLCIVRAQFPALSSRDEVTRPRKKKTSSAVGSCV